MTATEFEEAMCEVRKERDEYKAESERLYSAVLDSVPGSCAICDMSIVDGFAPAEASAVCAHCVEAYADIAERQPLEVTALTPNAPTEKAFAGQCLSRYLRQQCTFEAGPHERHESTEFAWLDDDQGPAPPPTAADIKRGQEIAAKLGLLDSDPLHPCGRCTCAGEGDCPWCQSTELRLERDQLRADLATARDELAQCEQQCICDELDAQCKELRAERDAARDEAARLTRENESWLRTSHTLRVERDDARAEAAGLTQERDTAFERVVQIDDDNGHLKEALIQARTLTDTVLRSREEMLGELNDKYRLSLIDISDATHHELVNLRVERDTLKTKLEVTEGALKSAIASNDRWEARADAEAANYGRIIRERDALKGELAEARRRLAHEDADTVTALKRGRDALGVALMERKQLKAELANMVLQRDYACTERDAVLETLERKKAELAARRLNDDFAGSEHTVLLAAFDAAQAELAAKAQLDAQLGQAMASAMRATLKANKQADEIERLKECVGAAAGNARRAHETAAAAQAELSKLRAAGPRFAFDDRVRHRRLNKHGAVTGVHRFKGDEIGDCFDVQFDGELDSSAVHQDDLEPAAEQEDR